MSGPGLGGGSQGQWGQEEKERREVGESEEEEGSYGPGCDCRQGMGVNWHAWRVGQVSTAGAWGRLEHLVWGRWNERRGAGEHPWGGDRFRVTRDESQAPWGSPSTVRAAWGSPASPIARVVSAVFNPNKRCHRHQETPVSLRVSVPPTGLGFGNRQCPLQAAAAGRDDHPVLPATPPARLSPRPLPGPGLGPVARGEFDRTVGVASGEAGRERDTGAQPQAAAERSGCGEPWPEGTGGERWDRGSVAAARRGRQWCRFPTPPRAIPELGGPVPSTGMQEHGQRDGAGQSEAGGWARRGGRCPVPGALAKGWGVPFSAPARCPGAAPPTH